MKNPLAKKIGISLISLASLMPLKAHAADVYLWGNIGLEAQAESSSIISVSSVPEDIRNVPVHPDDHYGGNAGPIKDSKVGLDAPLNVAINGNLGVGISEGNLDLKLGAGFRVDQRPYIERNYFGSGPNDDSRGVGAALTYYRLMARDFFPTFSARGSYYLSDPRENSVAISLFLDYTADFQKNLGIETGWDRYDALEKKDNYPLGDVLLHRIKAGIHIPLINHSSPINTGGFFEFYAGTNIPQIIGKTSLGNQVGWDSSPSFILGLKMGGEFDTLHSN